MNEFNFKSNDDGTCKLFISEDFAEKILYVPEKSPGGDKVVSLFLPVTFDKAVSFTLEELEEIIVDPENNYYSSFEGVLFDKNMTTLIQCPPKKSGKFIVPSSVRYLLEGRAFYQVCSLDEVIFQEGIKCIGDNTFYNMESVTLPKSLEKISDEAFCWNWMPSSSTTIRAPKNSAAHCFAVKKGCRYMPTDCPLTWNADSWLEKFRSDDADYRALRREVWKNTRAIVEDGGYTLPNGDSVLVGDKKRYSQFYYKDFSIAFEREKNPLEITVTAYDCLDAAHKWVNDGLEVCVLNMASRRNPGGGVTTGAGAQEEYLFRCSDYHKFLYRYAPYAEQYGVTRSHYQYPLDRNFGGIFSGGVTIFRENEESGYCLTDNPWKVNMIAVAGMNSPRLVTENGEERIAPELVDGVKNKIRTIFRIAIDRGQKNLILGAIGCGAFHNPPKHVAELFRDILCEHEFFGAFRRICFAVKTSHTSKGDTNFSAFKETLDGFIPTLTADPVKTFDNPIKKIVVGRGFYALLKTNGEVQVIDNEGKSRYFRRFRKSIDIAAGPYHLVGVREDGKVVFKNLDDTNWNGLKRLYSGDSTVFNDFNSQDSNIRYLKKWYGGIAIATCEGHSAMLRADGTVLCVDHPNNSPSGYPPTPEYSDDVESWRNIKQVALTYEEPFALTRDGKFFCRREDINNFFNICGKEIVQISALGAYYTNHVVAALYSDGTVRACNIYCDSYEALDDVNSWHNVKKICCICDTVIGLTNDGKIISGYREYKETKTLENIIDIAESGGFIALSSMGEIFY